MKIIGAISPAESFGVPYVPVDHSLQALYVATNDLLDHARTLAPSEVRAFVAALNVVRDRLDAVINRAHDQADGF